MNPSDDPNEPEPGFLQDWSFIVLAHGSTIYDLSTGILYEFHATMGRGDVDAVMVQRVGSAERLPLVEGNVARDFWRQLQARVEL